MLAAGRKDSGWSLERTALRSEPTGAEIELRFSTTDVKYRSIPVWRSMTPSGVHKACGRASRREALRTIPGADLACFSMACIPAVDSARRRLRSSAEAVYRP